MRSLIVSARFWQCAALIVLAAQAFLAQVRPAAVEGLILTDGTPNPVAGAVVEIRRVDGTAPQIYRGVSAGDGSFRIDGIRPGEYRAIARKPGFLTWEFGQRNSSRSGSAFNLDAGQSVQNLEIRLVPAGLIHGRLSDRRGNPVGAAEVFALVPGYRDGLRILKVFQSTVSDDRGYYRLFNLPPGSYYVSAMPFSGSGAILTTIVDGGANTPSLDNSRFTGTPLPGLTNLPHYFPGVLDARRASVIDLQKGGTFSGADFILAPSPTRYIRGSVGRGQAVSLVLAPLLAIQGTEEYTAAANPETGEFEFSGVAPGAYMLIARADDASGAQQIEVGESDILNVNVAIGGGFTIPGRLRIENRQPLESDPDMDHIFFDFVSDPVLPGVDAITYSPLYNGSFQLRNLIPGSYRFTNISIRGQAPRLQDAYIKSIRLADQDVLHRGLQVAGPVDGTLEIVVGLTPSSISGVVVNDAGQPVANAVVVLAVDTASRTPSDLYRVASTDAVGRFRLRPVTAGNFKLFAWSDVEAGAWQDPEFMKQFEATGRPVVVQENSNQEVRLIAQ